MKNLPNLFDFEDAKGALSEEGNACILQALETVKILSGMEPCYSGSLFLFDGLDGRGRLVKLRGRREGAQVTLCWSGMFLQYLHFQACKSTSGQGNTIFCSETYNCRAELSK